jgi:hypothetical protein
MMIKIQVMVFWTVRDSTLTSSEVSDFEYGGSEVSEKLVS